LVYSAHRNVKCGQRRIAVLSFSRLFELVDESFESLANAGGVKAARTPIATGARTRVPRVATRRKYRDNDGSGEGQPCRRIIAAKAIQDVTLNRPQFVKSNVDIECKRSAAIVVERNPRKRSAVAGQELFFDAVGPANGLEQTNVALGRDQTGVPFLNR
jgi:hypothetical protein